MNTNASSKCAPTNLGGFVLTWTSGKRVVSKEVWGVPSVLLRGILSGGYLNATPIISELIYIYI